MKDTSRQELLSIVRAALDEYSENTVAWSIADANNGRPDGYIVTDANLHLFRQYRNSVSPNPSALIKEALDSKEVSA
jgi:hypothetical protein